MFAMMADITTVTRSQVPRCSVDPLLLPLYISGAYTCTTVFSELQSHIAFSYTHGVYGHALAGILHEVESLCWGKLSRRI